LAVQIGHDGFHPSQPLRQGSKQVCLAEVGLAVAAGDAVRLVFGTAKRTYGFLTHGFSPWLKSGKLLKPNC
jgi:hypothetical protein